LAAIGQTFIPLMRQNERAYVDACSRGETRFNEAAFDQDVSLYRGEMLGSAFRHVVKSFQVRTWRDLRTEWETLSAADRATIDSWLPNLEADFKPMT
jgi:hypothetical protein